MWSGDNKATAIFRCWFLSTTGHLSIVATQTRTFSESHVDPVVRWFLLVDPPCFLHPLDKKGDSVWNLRLSSFRPRPVLTNQPCFCILADPDVTLQNLRDWNSKAHAETLTVHLPNIVGSERRVLLPRCWRWPWARKRCRGILQLLLPSTAACVKWTWAAVHENYGWTVSKRRRACHCVIGFTSQLINSSSARGKRHHDWPTSSFFKIHQNKKKSSLRKKN